MQNVKFKIARKICVDKITHTGRQSKTGAKLLFRLTAAAHLKTRRVSGRRCQTNYMQDRLASDDSPCLFSHLLNGVIRIGNQG
uniref:Uncharacterized protein n=1 Tax=Romanomermis culicivorax TaxID=13658 RepID=A0A915I5G8_ROMCU